MHSSPYALRVYGRESKRELGLAMASLDWLARSFAHLVKTGFLPLRPEA